LSIAHTRNVFTNMGISDERPIKFYKNNVYESILQVSAISNIKIFLKSKNSTQYRFYKVTGLSNGYFGRVKHMTDQALRKVHQAYPTLNMHWVITGKGEMELD